MHGIVLLCISNKVVKLIMLMELSSHQKIEEVGLNPDFYIQDVFLLYVGMHGFYSML